MARIVIFGGTGYTGTHLAREATGRGHEVVSFSRNPAVDPVDGVQYELGPISDPASRARALDGADVVVVSIPPRLDLGGYEDGVLALATEAAEAGVRLGVVGGAGSSLIHEGGPRLLDGDDFNPDWKPEATAIADTLYALRDTPDEVDWFYVSPAANYGAYGPQEQRGSYRTGDDVLVTDASGDSAISGADYAIAFIDEIEQKAHPRARFTVGW